MKLSVLLLRSVKKTQESKMAERNLRKGSTSLAIREMQIKTTLKFHLTLIRMVKIKNTHDDLCLRGYEVKETPLLSANWYSLFRYQYGDF